MSRLGIGLGSLSSKEAEKEEEEEAGVVNRSTNSMLENAFLYRRKAGICWIPMAPKETKPTHTTTNASTPVQTLPSTLVYYPQYAAVPSSTD